MVYKNFKINVALRVLVIAISIFLLFYSYFNNYHVTPIVLLLLTIFQVYFLIHFVEKTNRELVAFLDTIRFSEFSRTFEIEGMGSFTDLSHSFNEIIEDFQKVRSEKEAQYHYLQSILQHIDASIIAYQQDGTVEMINKAAKKLFQVNSLKNIQSLDKLSSELANTLLTIKPGQNKLVKVQDEDDLLQLAIFATEFKIKDKIIILATINNLQNVLEEQETDAWQRLIRVLTHEIMNSITPIASLSSTLDLMLKSITDVHKSTDPTIERETIMEIQQALQTINKRSTGLLHFVNTYRNLTRIPKPIFKISHPKLIFNSIKLLMEDELKKYNIELVISIDPEDIEFSADEQLIEQVIINLIKNSIHALETTENAKIQLKAFYNKRDRVTIQVIDNGQGILADVLDKIFIPFFTTKQSGSGIGLSLSRQILRLHNGTISAMSIPNCETIFTLTF